MACCQISVKGRILMDGRRGIPLGMGSSLANPQRFLEDITGPVLVVGGGGRTSLSDPEARETGRNVVATGPRDWV